MTNVDSNGYITPAVNIIIPPPDIRTIIDRTAEFVAEHGSEFEAKIIEKDSSSAKFSFLNKTSPYNAYYVNQVKDFKSGSVKAVSVNISVPTSMRLAQETPKAIQEVFEMKEPPKEFEFILDAPSINSLELDIIKLTAQYVARNGKSFLTNIMNREQRNYLFDFLRAQHNMFNYFTKLVEQYTKILREPEGIVKKLEEEASDPSLFLKDCKYRVAWERNQARIRKREMEIEDREKMAYAQIDWHDFVVVETVDQPTNEVGNFPPLTLPEEVGARLIAEERGESVALSWTEERIKAVQNEEEYEEKEEEGVDQESDEETKIEKKEEEDVELDDNMDVSDNEERSDDDGDDEPNIPPPPPLPTSKPALFKPPPPPSTLNDAVKGAPIINPDDVIVKPYDASNRSRKINEEYVLISPLGDSKKIGADQANKHIHVSLLNPNWKDDRDRNMKKLNQEDTTYATGSTITQNLQVFAERRTDIFGSEETHIGRTVHDPITGATSAGPVVYNAGTKRSGRSSSGVSSKYGVDAVTTANEASIRRANEQNSRLNDNINEKIVDDDEMTRIGPQAVPQILPIPALPPVRVIVNNPPPPPPPMPMNNDSGEPPEKKSKQ